MFFYKPVVKPKMSDIISLTWTDFGVNLSTALSLHRNESEFYDVTLVSDDQKLLSAHKVVLSSSSEYFKNILKQNKHPNPLLCLEGINFNEMNSILDYVYHGEVNIYQDDLDRFLNIAERLKLEGLMSDRNSAGDEKEDTKKIIDDSKEIVLKDVPDNPSFDRSYSTENRIVMKSDDYSSIEELDAKILD